MHVSVYVSLLYVFPISLSFSLFIYIPSFSACLVSPMSSAGWLPLFRGFLSVFLPFISILIYSSSSFHLHYCLIPCLPLPDLSSSSHNLCHSILNSFFCLPTTARCIGWTTNQGSPSRPLPLWSFRLFSSRVSLFTGIVPVSPLLLCLGLSWCLLLPPPCLYSVAVANPNSIHSMVFGIQD